MAGEPPIDAPVLAVRVAPEPTASAPAVSPQLPPEGSSAQPVAEAAPALATLPEPAPAAAAQVPAVIEPVEVKLVGERPSLLETVGDKPKPADDKPQAEPGKPADPAAKPVEVKPVEVKPVEVKPAEVKPAEAEPAKPAELLPVVYQYKLPDTLKMDDGLRTELHTALDAFRTDPVAAGPQALIDLHDKTMAAWAKDYDARAITNQHATFNKMRDDWNKLVLSDEEFGGAGHQTAARAVARMRDQFVSSEPPGTPRYTRDLAEFETFLRVTGAGDHPSFWRFLHNVAAAFDEPGLPPVDPRPAKTNGQNPSRSRDRMYDHPSSQKTS